VVLFLGDYAAYNLNYNRVMLSYIDNLGTPVLLMYTMQCTTTVSSQIDARLNFLLGCFPHRSFPVRRYLFILRQYIFYVQVI